MAKLYANELRIRTQLILAALFRVLSGLGVQLPALPDDLKQELDYHLSESHSEFHSSLEHAAHLINFPAPGDMLLQVLQSEKKRAAAEIDLYVASRFKSDDEKQGQPQTFNIGSVGAIQFGAGSSARVVQNLGLEDKKHISEALELAKRGLERESAIYLQKSRNHGTDSSR